MVLGDIGRGHQNRGLAQQLQFRDGAGTGSGDNEVGGTIGHVHVADERHLHHVLHARRFEGLTALLVIELARLPDDLDVIGPLTDVLQAADDGVVDGARSQAAADDEDGLLGGVKAHGLAGLFGCRPTVEQVAPDGIAGKHNLFGREKALHAFIGHTDAVGLSGQQFVGHAGIGVLLLQQGGNALFLSRLEHRSAGITAHADGDVGLEVLEDFLGQTHALEQPGDHLDVTQQVLTVKAAHGQTDDIVPGSRDSFHLHASLGADKEDAGIREAALHFVGNGQGGENVAAGAATAHEYIQLLMMIVTSRHFLV